MDTVLLWGFIIFAVGIMVSLTILACMEDNTIVSNFTNKEDNAIVSNFTNKQDSNSSDENLAFSFMNVSDNLKTFYAKTPEISKKPIESQTMSGIVANQVNFVDPNDKLIKTDYIKGPRGALYVIDTPQNYVAIDNDGTHTQEPFIKILAKSHNSMPIHKVHVILKPSIKLTQDGFKLILKKLNKQDKDLIKSVVLTGRLYSQQRPFIDYLQLNKDKSLDPRHLCVALNNYFPKVYFTELEHSFKNSNSHVKSLYKLFKILQNSEYDIQDSKLPLRQIEQAKISIWLIIQLACLTKPRYMQNAESYQNLQLQRSVVTKIYDNVGNDLNLISAIKNLNLYLRDRNLLKDLNHQDKQLTDDQLIIKRQIIKDLSTLCDYLSLILQRELNYAYLFSDNQQDYAVKLGRFDLISAEKRAKMYVNKLNLSNKLIE